MQGKSDVQLLGEYVRHRSEEAFGEIVARYTNLIYSTVLRQIGSVAVAEDVAQSVFTDLARKAPELARRFSENGALVGWLYRSSRFALAKYLRENHRRQTRETQAMQELDPSTEPSPDWERVRPVLDEALAELNETDRQAMLHRFFRNQGFQAIGAALGISDDAAQKRVGRALEKLRAHLARHGITTTAAMLASVLSTHAVQTAPAGMAAKLATASLAGAAATSGSALTIMKIFTLTPLKVGLIGAGIVAGLAGWLTVEHGSMAKIEQENAGLRQQLGELDQLRAQNQQLSSQQANGDELARLRSEHSELLRLRGENGRLRASARATNEAPAAMSAGDQAELAQFRAEARAKAVLISLVNAMKILGTSVRIYGNHNDDKLPSDLGQLSGFGVSEIGWPDGMSTNSIEFISYDKPLDLDKNSQYPFARLKQPLQQPDGSYVQVYLMVDGSVQQAKPEDGNFDEWEDRWIARAIAAETARANGGAQANSQ